MYSIKRSGPPIVLACFMLLFISQAKAQRKPRVAPEGQVYKKALKLDIPLAIGGAGLAVAGFLSESRLAPMNPNELAQLDRANIGNFNRGATYNWSTSAAGLSDVLLLSSGVVPLSMVLVPTRSRERLSIGIMAAEAFFWTYGITSGVKGTSRRIRPYAYGTEAPLEKRLDSDTRASFPSGHASHAALACFFGAKVYSDLYPERKSRYFAWGAAGLFSGTVAWLRVRAGKHYPTDVIAGTALGAGIGILIPHLHKKERKYFSMAPFPGGLQLAWQF